MSTKAVLLVDDNEDAVVALGTLLRMESITVMEAFTGMQALDIAARSHLDAVVLDLGLPDISGYDVADAIRSQPWGAQLKLIALTGWSDEAHTNELRRSLFDHYLVKPAQSDELVRLLLS